MTLIVSKKQVSDGTTPQYKKLIKRAKALGVQTVSELEELIAEEFSEGSDPITGADFEEAKKQLRLDSAFISKTGMSDSTKTGKLIVGKKQVSDGTSLSVTKVNGLNENGFVELIGNGWSVYLGKEDIKGLEMLKTSGTKKYTSTHEELGIRNAVLANGVFTFTVIVYSEKGVEEKTVSVSESLYADIVKYKGKAQELATWDSEPMGMLVKKKGVISDVSFSTVGSGTDQKIVMTLEADEFDIIEQVLTSAKNKNIFTGSDKTLVESLLKKTQKFGSSSTQTSDSVQQISDSIFNTGIAVYNSDTKTVGIVLTGEKQGEVKTDSEGVVSTEKLTALLTKSQLTKQLGAAKVAPSTVWALYRMGDITLADVEKLAPNLVFASIKAGEKLLEDYDLNK